jgi:hypothetical protein
MEKRGNGVEIAENGHNTGIGIVEERESAKS